MLDMLNTLLKLLFPPKCLICGGYSEKCICEGCFLRIKFIDRIEGDVYFVGAYEGVLEKAIKLLKFRLKKKIARDLSFIMLNHNPFADFDLIVPIPLHNKRMAERGFNQSAEIAADLSKKTGKPVICDVLIRSRDTRHQFELSPRERALNIKGAFTVKDPAKVCGKKFLVIDDIYTTGATIDECRRCLLSAGAGSVHSLVLSRTLPL